MKLNTTSTTLTVGQSTTLTATVSPSNSTNKNVAWSSNNTSVATVGTDGKVTAKAAGTAVITVKTADVAKTATCTVTVKNPTVNVTGVSITNKKNVYLDAATSQTFQCAVTVSPNNATNKNVTYSSSNTNVVTVSASGKITAKEAGKATVTVKTADGGKTDSITIYVYRTYSGSAGNFQSNGQWYNIKAYANNEYSMNVYDLGNTNGTKVGTWKSTNLKAQIWQCIAFNGGVKLVPNCAQNMALDVNRGTVGAALKAGCKLNLWNVNDDAEAHTWQLIKFWADGVYGFKLKGYDLVVTASELNGTTQLTVQKFDPANANQKWKVEVSKGNSSSGSSTTNIASKVAIFKAAVPEGHAHNHATYTVNGVIVGWECFGFANLMAYNIWGSYPTTVSSAQNVNSNWTIIRATSSNSQINSLKVGDIVRYNNGSYDHSIFVTDIVGDTIYYADCNRYGDDVVHYNGTMSKSTLASKLVRQLVYNPGYYGWIAHCKHN